MCTRIVRVNSLTDTVHTNYVLTLALAVFVPIVKFLCGYFCPSNLPTAEPHCVPQTLISPAFCLNLNLNYFLAKVLFLPLSCRICIWALLAFLQRVELLDFIFFLNNDLQKLMLFKTLKVGCRPAILHILSVIFKFSLKVWKPHATPFHIFFS
jgi:hypothetical protein